MAVHFVAGFLVGALLVLAGALVFVRHVRWFERRHSASLLDSCMVAWERVDELERAMLPPDHWRYRAFVPKGPADCKVAE